MHHWSSANINGSSQFSSVRATRFRRFTKTRCGRCDWLERFKPYIEGGKSKARDGLHAKFGHMMPSLGGQNTGMAMGTILRAGGIL